MRANLKVALVAAIVCASTGCSTDPEPPHNEKYFDENPKARVAMMKRCAKDQHTENPFNCMAAENSNRDSLLRQPSPRK